MSRNKTLKTEYKHVEIIMHVSTGKYSINHLDLTGEYDSLEDAEKAVRVWLKPEGSTTKDTTPAVKVLVAEYLGDGEFEEGTTRFAEKTNESSWYGNRIWVSCGGSKKAVRRSAVFADTKANRAIFAAVEKNNKLQEKLTSKMEKERTAMERKLKVAKE